MLSEAEAAIASLNATQPPALKPLARLLLRTESIASSKVEGLQIDARSLARAEVKQEIGKPIGTDAIEILASIDAMQLAVEQAAGAGAIREKDLRDVHAALMANSTVIKPGKIRTVQNWIGGNNYNPCEAAFVPPPPEDVPALLKDLCKFCNDDSLSPLVQAAVAHAQFETIHPFEDGNGRTGRALAQIILRRRGLAPDYVPPVSVILARQKASYIRGLTLFREDKLAEWLTIFAEAAASAARLAQRYLALVAQLQERWRTSTRRTGLRADAAAWTIIDVLPAHPAITISVAMAATGRTRPAVAHAIDQLVSCGVLVPLAESQRNRSWEATGLLDLIVGLENGE